MNQNTNNNIEVLIYNIRGQKVMLDHDLAKLYGVETKALNRAVKRNLVRFPPDAGIRSEVQHKVIIELKD